MLFIIRLMQIYSVSLLHCIEFISMFVSVLLSDHHGSKQTNSKTATKTLASFKFRFIFEARHHFA